MSFDYHRSIFDHVQLGVSSRAESERFYRTVLEPLGIPVVSDTDDGIMFAHFAIREDRPVSNEVHLAFQASTNEQVDAFHRAGVEAGYRDNGAPGPSAIIRWWAPIRQPRSQVAANASPRRSSSRSG